MIFVWSSNGGPLLQGVSLLLLVLQFAPHLLANGASRTIVAVLVGGAMLAYGLYHSRPGAIQRIQNALRQEYRALRNLVAGGGAATTTIVISAAIAMAGAVVTSLALYADEGQFVSLALTVVQMIGMVLFFHHAMTQILQQQRQQNDNQNDRNPQDRIHEIVNLVLKLPIEEFVPQEQMACCKVSQLQEMLRIRSSGDGNTTTTTANASFVEKNDLVAAVTKVRNYNDTCCICYEEYQAGDPLRVLPHCRHEFHVECLDQWAYTFANERRRRQGGRRQPTCPLCNTAL